jgi:hypothetical protein
MSAGRAGLDADTPAARGGVLVDGAPPERRRLLRGSAALLQRVPCVARPSDLPHMFASMRLILRRVAHVPRDDRAHSFRARSPPGGLPQPPGGAGSTLIDERESGPVVVRVFEQQILHFSLGISVRSRHHACLAQRATPGGSARSRCGSRAARRVGARAADAVAPPVLARVACLWQASFASHGRYHASGERRQSSSFYRKALAEGFIDVLDGHCRHTVEAVLYTDHRWCV